MTGVTSLCPGCHSILLVADGPCACRLGEIDVRAGYHTPTALWPLGLCAVVADAEAGTFRSEIVEGSADGPTFRVTLELPEGEAVVRRPRSARQKSVSA